MPLMISPPRHESNTNTLANVKKEKKLFMRLSDVNSNGQLAKVSM